MIFSSIQFLIFFLIFFISLKIFPKKQRINIILFSLFFYGFWNPIFVSLIFFFLIFTYYFLKNEVDLKISIPVILIPLFYFKYSFFIGNLFNLNFMSNFSYRGDLPLAISFITFTAIAILIDVKTKKFNEKINFLTFSEFLIYFPQLIAGPILRANELIPLLRDKIIFKSDNLKFGITLFTIGFVKKIFFADSIANFIDPIFENPESLSPEDYFKGFLLFPLQIYFDFSGYIDMALGISKILNINLPINFNKPYLSQSITEFWRNWHITLSRWFRDYLYIPLGGSKHGEIKLFGNLLITMSIAGLWHGASLNFILWGFLNGLFLYFEKKLSKFFNLNKFFKILITCFIIFNLWIIFRIQEFDLMYKFLFNLYVNIKYIFYYENILLFLITILAVISQKYDNFQNIKQTSLKFNFSILIPIVIIILITGLAINTGTSDKFIYFDF